MSTPDNANCHHYRSTVILAEEVDELPANAEPGTPVLFRASLLVKTRDEWLPMFTTWRVRRGHSD